MKNIREADWKHLRQLKPVALERYCKRVLAEVAQTGADEQQPAQERYLSTYKLIHERDGELAMLFDNTKRSTAMEKILLLRRYGLFTDDEWTGFTEEIRSIFEPAKPRL